MAVDLARVRAVIDRIAADADELARAWRARDLHAAAVLPDRRAERRRRLAEPDLEFRAFCPAGIARLINPATGPGTPGRPNGTGAARPASGRATPATRSGHADHPPACPRARVQETGRRSGAHGSIVTGTPTGQAGSSLFQRVFSRASASGGCAPRPGLFECRLAYA